MYTAEMCLNSLLEDIIQFIFGRSHLSPRTEFWGKLLVILTPVAWQRG